MIVEIYERKEKVRMEIQTIFTKIRNVINEKEEKLLSDVDKYFNQIFCKKDIITENEKLPYKIKISLEKGKIVDNEWNDENKLNSLINDCINIEKNIRNIK